MLSALGEELVRDRRWHALFDLRLIEARFAQGLPVVGETGVLPAAARDAFEERSRLACLEVGWPLLEEGQVASAWMYLRASAELEDVASRLEQVASTLEGREDDDARRLLEELVHVTLWEAVHPPLGLKLLLVHNGTCNTVTAYDQSVSRLPPARQAAAAEVMVNHLTEELIANLQSDLTRRGLKVADITTLPGLLEAAGDPAAPLGPHVDVSHLHSVLRFGRVCTDAGILQKSLDLAVYADRLPEELRYPGDGPFTEMAKASRLFYGACLGEAIEEAVVDGHDAGATNINEADNTVPPINAVPGSDESDSGNDGTSGPNVRLGSSSSLGSIVGPDPDPEAVPVVVAEQGASADGDRLPFPRCNRIVVRDHGEGVDGLVVKG